MVIGYTHAHTVLDYNTLKHIKQLKDCTISNRKIKTHSQTDISPEKLDGKNVFSVIS